MAGGFNIDITIDDAELRHAVTAGPAIAVEELTAATWEGELLIEREVKERTPVGVFGSGGGLRGSISARTPEVLGDKVRGVTGTASGYALPVEIGTKPHFPPIAPIALWAQKKLGVTPEEAPRAGYLIARKISRVGTQGQHMFRDGFAAVRSQVVDAYARARDRIVARMAGGK